MFPQSQQRDLNPEPWDDEATVLPLYSHHWPITAICNGRIMFIALSPIQLVLSVNDNFTKAKTIKNLYM